MYIPFEEMPGHSRAWVYTCSRALSLNETQRAAERLTAFCEQWAAHGHPMKSSFLISHHRFIVMAADEQATSASGCSIDSSTRMISELGISLDVDFFDRQVAFWMGDQVVLIPLKDLGESFRNNRIDRNTLSFPQQAATINEWINGPVPAVATWLKRYLPAVGETTAIRR